MSKNMTNKLDTFINLQPLLVLLLTYNYVICNSVYGSLSAKSRRCRTSQTVNM